MFLELARATRVPTVEESNGTAWGPRSRCFIPIQNYIPFFAVSCLKLPLLLRPDPVLPQYIPCRVLLDNSLRFFTASC